MSVLVVDDDPKLRRLLREVLETDGFDVIEATSADEVMTILASQPLAMITLDIRLGEDNGLQIARDIRAISQVPIIMLTGQDDVIDRVVGLEIGADDYITKPFHIREVIARVRSVLRRAAPQTTEAGPEGTAAEAPRRCLRFDELIVDLERMELRDREGGDCPLTSGEFRLLTVFLEHPMRVLNRDQLMNLIGGADWNPLDRTIDNQVARLRKKIERAPANPKLIKTIRGAGYKFVVKREELEELCELSR